MHDDLTLTPGEEALNALLEVRAQYEDDKWGDERAYIDQLLEYYKEAVIKENGFLDAGEILNDGIENFGIF